LETSSFTHYKIKIKIKISTFATKKKKGGGTCSVIAKESCCMNFYHQKQLTVKNAAKLKDCAKPLNKRDQDHWSEASA
jgi:replicative superfamily II helicase